MFFILICILIFSVISSNKLLKTTYYDLSAEQVIKKISSRILFVRIFKILLIIFLILTVISVPNYLPMFIYTIIQIFLLRFYLQASNSSILTILHEECDPYKYEQTQLAYRKYAKRELSKNIINYNLAVALNNQGNYDDALRAAGNMTYKKFNPNMLLCYYTIVSFCYFQSGNFDMIQKIQNDIYLLKENPRIKKSRKFSFQMSCDKVLRQNIEYFLLEQSGNTEANYTLNYALLSEAKKTLEKVNLHLRLAKLDYRTGNTEGARIHCAYVIQNGNKLYAVTKANELLQAMEA